MGGGGEEYRFDATGSVYCLEVDRCENSNENLGFKKAVNFLRNVTILFAYTRTDSRADLIWLLAFAK
jgi:hypothetical protein